MFSHVSSFGEISFGIACQSKHARVFGLCRTGVLEARCGWDLEGSLEMEAHTMVRVGPSIIDTRGDGVIDRNTKWFIAASYTRVDDNTLAAIVLLGRHRYRGTRVERRSRYCVEIEGTAVRDAVF
ncbi:unnamed protein product [Pylaiella littoralis]